MPYYPVHERRQRESVGYVRGTYETFTRGFADAVHDAYFVVGILEIFAPVGLPVPRGQDRRRNLARYGIVQILIYGRLPVREIEPAGIRADVSLPYVARQQLREPPRSLAILRRFRDRAFYRNEHYRYVPVHRVLRDILEFGVPRDRQIRIRRPFLFVYGQRLPYVI